MAEVTAEIVAERVHEFLTREGKTVQVPDLAGRPDFRGAKFTGILLRGQELESCDFTGVQLVDADLDNCNLKGTVFQEAQLRGVTLRGSNLERSDFRRASLLRVKFTCANLKGATLEDARCEGVGFDRADVRDVNLRINRLSGEDTPATTFQGALYDVNTRWAPEISAKGCGAQIFPPEVELKSEAIKSWDVAKYYVVSYAVFAPLLWLWMRLEVPEDPSVAMAPLRLLLMLWFPSLFFSACEKRVKKLQYIAAAGTAGTMIWWAIDMFHKSVPR